MKPKLIHHVAVLIANVSVTSTEIDPDFNEPVSGDDGTAQITYETPTEYKAQVRIYRYKQLNGIVSGFEEIGDGYLLLYKEDAVGIKTGAKISSIDGMDVEYYVTDPVPRVYYDSSKFTALYFAAREKAKRV